MTDAIVKAAEPAPRKERHRVVTLELAQRIAAILLETDDQAPLGLGHTHTIESASVAVGIRGGTVRELLRRYADGKCATEEDEEIGAVIDDARTEHLRRMRGLGFAAAGNNNRAGTSWIQWQLEIQDPKNHPRKQALEVSGPDGGPVETKNDTTVRYVVSVPPTEPEDNEE